MFTDRIRLTVRAGKGGNGVVAWHRAKYIPKGGPCGGNGGRGGSIYLEATSQLFSLEDYRNRRILCAENGVQGGPNLRQGRRGRDLTIRVPCGTLVKDLSNEALLYDLTQDGERVLLCAGGKGGLGNNHFKTPTRQAPNFCTHGREGEEREVELELKMIADVGLVGFPNAGKSSLFGKLTEGKAKVGAYPFTTLHPHIGFVEHESRKRLYLADIPGIIGDAHKNRGLGLDFLRHIERTSFLLFVVDASGYDGRDPVSDYEILRNELASYDRCLLERPHAVVLNKMDLDGAREEVERFRTLFPEEGLFFPVSAVTGEGIDPLRGTLKAMIGDK